MCLIVYKPDEELDFTEEHFNNAWVSNPHGVGFMWTENGRVNIKKTRDKVKGLRLFKRLKHKRNFSMHFRFRTAGATDIHNVHPFQILRKDEDGIDLFLMHNGVLSVHEPKPQFSDTWHFAKNYLRPILKNNWEFILTPEFDDLISAHIKGSKLLFLYANDKFEGEIIFNKKDGKTRDNGTWVSNECFISTSRYSYYGGEWDDKYTYSRYDDYDRQFPIDKKEEKNLTPEELFEKEFEESPVEGKANLVILNEKRTSHLEELRAELSKIDIIQDMYSQISNLSELKLEELITSKPDNIFLLLEFFRQRGSWEEFGMDLIDLEKDVEDTIKEYNQLLSKYNLKELVA